MASAMPPAEVEVTTALVEGLIADQCPGLADRTVTEISFGWDNFTFRVGGRLVARLPRRQVAVPLVENEARWLPSIGKGLPLAIPTPVFLGGPGRGYPWPWALVRRVPGHPVTGSPELDLESAADTLAGFLRALHRPAPVDAPANPFRGVPLRERDDVVRKRIDMLRSALDAKAVLELWESALRAPELESSPVWIHGDLHPANLMARHRRLTGVIDFGDITGGDPATDLAIAWMIFPQHLRARFFDAYGDPDPPTLERARGWAVVLGLAFLANSADNDTMLAIGRSTMGRLLPDR